MPIYISDRIYIPEKWVLTKKMLEPFDRRIFDDKTCHRCETFINGERFAPDICGQCPAYKGHYQTFSKTKIKNKPFIAVPNGNISLVEDIFNLDLSQAKDIRAVTPARYPLTFTKKLFQGQIVNDVETVDQLSSVKEFWKEKRGFLVAPPRSGKTVMAARLITAYKMRTLIVAHDEELLKQMLRTLLKFTNLKEQRQQTGKKIAGIIKSDKDFNEKWDIVLCTYQKFIRPKTGQTRINKYIRGQFGVFMIDEAHRANAFAYSRFANHIDAKYKIALSATPERKDRLEWIAEQIMGPVVVQVEQKGLTPLVDIVDTGITWKYEPRGNTAYLKITRSLGQDPDRLKLLAKHIFHDLRSNPNTSIIVPVLYVNECVEWAKMINRLARYYNETRQENWPLPLAVPYFRGVNKDQTLSLVRSKKVRVTFAIRKMVAEGIDVPAWTHMYLQFPINNAPNFYQMTQRICTPAPDKPQPVLKYFVDRLGISLGCFVSSWFNGIKKFGYTTPVKTYQKAQELIKLKESLKAPTWKRKTYSNRGTYQRSTKIGKW